MCWNELVVIGLVAWEREEDVYFDDGGFVIEVGFYNLEAARGGICA